MTRDTLIHIKGTILKALFSRRWDKNLSRYRDGRTFLDINPAYFWTVVDYLNNFKTMSLDSTLKNPLLGENDNIVLKKFYWSSYYDMTDWFIQQNILVNQKREKTRL